MTNEFASMEAEMMKIILGKWISKPVYAAAKLGISDILTNCSMDINEIADKTSTHSPSLYRLMRALSCVGIFSEVENRVFINTPLSECLGEKSLKYASLLFHSDWHDKVWDNILYTISTGKPSFDHIFGEPAFEWLKKRPEQSEIFHKASAHKARSSNRGIVDVYDFAGIRSITDAGGGNGALMVEILTSHLTMEGVVAELPETIPHIDKLIKETGFENRMRAAECDFFIEIPAGSDAYLLSNVLHDWPDDDCIRILQNCRKAMGARGKLLIAETVISPGNEFSIAKLLDIEVLLMGGGKERCINEYETLFEKSGFKLTNVFPTGESISLIEGDMV